MCADVQTKVYSRQCFSNDDEAEEYFLQTSKSKGVLVEVGGLEPTCLRGVLTTQPGFSILSTVRKYSSQVTLHNAMESKAL